MSQAKRIDRFIIIMAISILLAVVLMNVVPINQIQFPWLASLTVNPQNESASDALLKVTYNDTLVQDYARRQGVYGTGPAAAPVQHTDALALDYARRLGGFGIAPASTSVEFSDALGLDYARRLGGFRIAPATAPIEYNDALALDYARQYGSWETGK